VVSQLVRLTSDQPVRTLCCNLGQDALLSRCQSPPSCVMGTGDFNAGGKPAMD